MSKIVVTGAGSAQSNGVINCLLMDQEKNEIIGLGSDRYDLMLSKAHKKYLVPYSTERKYKEVLLNILKDEKPDMIHFQHDKELFSAMAFRNEIERMGVKMLLPSNETIDTCVHKYKSYVKFLENGLKVPKNIVINSPDDLKEAFETLGNTSGSIWLRSMLIGGGGLGSLPTNNYDEAFNWIEKRNGWGSFVAAELLTKNTVTWLSIWKDGELIAAQGRTRSSWASSALSVSGVTGMTKVGVTYSNPVVDEIGKKACYAVSDIPNGIFGVDMTYDEEGIPNPTEINIGRFFTTVEFFSRAGLNLPVILKDLCLYDKKPTNYPLINPLRDGLLWIRGMDERPVFTDEDKIDEEIIKNW